MGRGVRGGRPEKMFGTIAAFWILALLAIGPGAAAWQVRDTKPPLGPVEPRELSDAERAAVEIAAAYLYGGSEAVWQRLSKDSPLRRLDRPEALREIAARLGPADGSAWQLLTPGPTFDRQIAIFGVEYASGLDETLIFRLVDEGGWKISEIRTSVDRVDPVQLNSAWRNDLAVEPASPAPGPEAEETSESLFTLPVLLQAGGGFVLLLGIAGAFLLARKGRRPVAVAAGIGALAVASGLIGWGFFAGSASEGAEAAVVTQEKDVGFIRLAKLAPLRTALAAGTDRATIDKELAAAPSDPALRDVHDLWKAQFLLSESDLAAVDALLKRFPERGPHPLAELLRARLAFRRLQRDLTGRAYEQALRGGLDHDGLRLEAAMAQSLTDDGGGAEISVALMVEMGSRLAEVWYAAAQIAVTEGRMEAAENLLHHGWQLEPAPRESLFGEPLLAFLVARPSLFPLFELGVAEEPRIEPTGDRRPVPLPPGTGAATNGQTLRLAIGSAELLVPGGAVLAPTGAVLENADLWSRHAEAKALAALPALTASAAAGESLPPRRLRIAEDAGRVLAARNRWEELIALTATVTADLQKAPSALVRLRAQALRQVGRTEEARQLLLRLAGGDIANRRPAPGTLFELAELFAAAGEYETAIKLSKKADSQLPEPRGERRRRQMAMDQQLAASYANYQSDHFDVRYPPATGELYARGVSLVLEEERRRLLRWIPKPGPKRIEVHLFPIRDFMSVFGGDISVVGVYDGKVRVPFADVQSLHPELVQILSHELAHAMIAGATRDQAPHWLQEGLAEHVEMGLGRLNPLPDLARTGRALSFPTLEPILSGFAEEQLVDLGYAEAAWTVHFIESRFGVKAVHGLLNAFATGKTTEEAIQDVCGLSLAEFDRGLWDWGANKAPQARNLEVRRYDVAYAARLVREQTEEVQASPAAVTAGRRKRGSELLNEDEERKRRMAAWYARYTARTVGVKTALKPVLASYQGQQAATMENCLELNIAATRALNELPLWTSPEPNVNRVLRNAYQSLAQVGKACQDGRDVEARGLLARATRQLSEAARSLEPHGMTP
jgi:tetratricopeptide (TPR) repeat protein